MVEIAQTWECAAPAERLRDHRKEQGSNRQISEGMKIMYQGPEMIKADLAAAEKDLDLLT